MRFLVAVAVSLATVATTISTPAGAATGLAFGVIDRIDVTPSSAVVHGWAIDPDGDRPTTLHVYVDDDLVATGVADRERADVGARHGVATSGYSIELGSLDAGPRSLCVWAINQNSGHNARLACRHVTVPDGSPVGTLDRVDVLGDGRVRVHGWVIDPDGPTSSALHFYSDGDFAGSASAGLRRDDVGERWGTDPHRGYSAELAALRHGSQEICVWAIDEGAGHNRRIGCERVDVVGARSATRGRLTINGTGDVRADPWWYGPGSDFARALAGLGGLFHDDDLTVINLECAPSPLGSPVPKNFNFRCSRAALAQFAADGVDVANMANNHALDYGPAAMLDGITNVELSGLRAVGAGLDADDAYAPVTFEREGWRIAVLGMAGFVEFGWNLAGPNHPGLASGYDIAAMQRAVSSAASTNDIVIVSIHWGREGVTAQNASQTERARALVDAGADIVFGHHPHRLQPVERYRDGLIFYSLGNFVWPRLSAASADTAVGQVVVDPDGSRRACLLDTTILAHGRPVLDRPDQRSC